MKHLIILFYSLFILFSCSDKSKPQVIELNVNKFELVETDSYGFRRAYHGLDTLEGEEFDLFMNRNPEPNEDYTDFKEHPLYKKLHEKGIFLNGNLNLSQIDTLPNQFNYQVSPNRKLKVKTKLLEDPKEIEIPSFELTFTNNNKIVLIDTLEFGWPPDVTFFKLDINNDGKEELLSIYSWYIINGDNFDLNIYELRE